MTMTRHQKKEQDAQRKRTMQQIDEQERRGPVKMWRDNLTSNEWEIELDEIANRFVASRYNSSEFLNSWRLERVIRCFLTAKDGLSSVFDENDYERIHEAIRARVFPKG